MLTAGRVVENIVV